MSKNRTRNQQKNRSRSLILKSIILIFILASAKFGIYDNFQENPSGASNLESRDSCRVTRIVDGDTVIVNRSGKETRVRLIGIDTPESVSPQEERNVPQGKMAAEYTEESLLNKEVTLEYDKEAEDKYGRTLAYIYVNGEMFNKELLKKGYARVINTYPNVKYEDEFKELQKEARNSRAGFWGDKGFRWK
ncbi:MAG: thermonuclease family protein [Peptostreptococcaceae bacterium]|nr:thermonuclease family protein [Peptostreptococcaceae bacterium]MDY5739625.1 thermonuclease family protein [Anaerovoracaceae bacterium]